MRRRIEAAVTTHGSCRLSDLLAQELPPGVVDVVGYLQIACEDRHVIQTDVTVELVLSSLGNGLRTWEVTVPLVTFLARET